MSLLDKIKKHGVSESLDIARQHAVDAANNAVFRLCKCFPLCPNRIVLESLKKRPGQTGLPLFETAESLAEFSDFLQKNNILLIFKLHHLQAELPVFRAVLPNITVIRDADLAAARSSRSAPPCPSST